MVSNILLKSCCAENLLWRAITEPAAISEFVWVTTAIGRLLLREKLQYRTFQTCPPPHGLLTSWQTGHSTWDWAVVRPTWWCAVPEPLGGLRYAMRTDTREMDVDLRRKRMSCVYPVTGCWCDGVHKQPGHRHWQAALKDQHRGVVCLCAVQQDVGGFLTDHSSVASRAVVCWGSIISWWHQQTE